MASPVAIRELRAICTTAFSSNHSNAAAAPWTTAPKVEISSYDDSGLTRDGLPGDTLKTRLYEEEAPTPGLAKGTVKFSTRALGAYANVDPHMAAIIMNAVLGGIASPVTNRNVACAAGSSTTIINIATCNSFMVAGQALLVGRKGDTRGNGEVKPIRSCNAGAAILGIPCLGAPAENDPVVISTTCYPNEDAPQSYIDTLAIGKATADQRQTIGGMGPLTFSGLGTSERPAMTVDLAVADHQTVAVGDRAALQPSVPPKHTAPAFTKGIGMLQVGDYNVATRALMKYADISHEPGIAYAPVPGPGGVNGIEGHQKVKGQPKLTATFLYDEDMPGLEADFDAETTKTVIAQFGSEMGRCFAIELFKAFQPSRPVPAAAGPLAGVKTTFVGTDDYNSTSNVRSAAVKYHMF